MQDGSKDMDGVPKLARETPFRSPVAVSEAIRNIIADKDVCDIGCGEGDHMLLMSQYAKSVVGIERREERYLGAQERGLKVLVDDYLTVPLPNVDVYYFWPNDPRDNPKIVKRILRNPDFHGHIIVGGDPQAQKEEEIIRMLARKYHGEVLEVPYNEGKKHRQFGIFLLAVIRVL